MTQSPATPPGPDAVLFVGTATTLIRFGGFTILTDPNFLHRGEEAHLGYGLRSRRLTEPALTLEQLPPLDLLVLSHLHEDHFDRRVQAELDRRLPILTNPQAAAALRGLGFGQARDLRTWQSWSFRKGDLRLRVTSLPAQHTPLRLLQPLLPMVMGSLLTFSTVTDDRTLLRLYISGDTLLHDALAEIPLRFPDIDLGLLHLGGTRIMGLLLTMDARQGLAALRLIEPKLAVPIHYDDYSVFRSPLDDFRRAVETAGLGERVRYLARGEALPLTSAPRARALQPSPP
jgi:L-ascorbate metabolism protein UlaG (beta-lactamase superfamily)